LGETGYPRFSGQEMRRRREALTRLLDSRGLTHALVYGADRSGTAIQWLTGWPVTREAALVFSPGERSVMFVCYDNHVPNARRMALDTDVRAGGRSALTRALDLLAARTGGATGVLGPVPARAHEQLLAATGRPVFLDDDYTGLRLVKSPEELDWLREGARMSDASVAALAAAARPGMTESEAWAALEGAYVAAGGQTLIHYLAVTAMGRPAQCVPAQWPAARPMAAGDALSCEVSATYWGYAGQLLRTFTIAADPAPLYRDLYQVADAAFAAMTSRLGPGATAADLLDAASLIKTAGFTVYDDLAHGYGGGYLPPILTRAHLEHGGAPEFTFAPGMTVVIQPNVVTPDERAGVQTGEMLLVTGDGWESLHRFPRGLARIG
jgi:Xaa-Pro aminopeptidase